jgi:hypothetical protein
MRRRQPLALSQVPVWVRIKRSEADGFSSGTVTPKGSYWSHLHTVFWVWFAVSLGVFRWSTCMKRGLGLAFTGKPEYGEERHCVQQESDR